LVAPPAAPPPATAPPISTTEPTTAPTTQPAATAPVIVEADKLRIGGSAVVTTTLDIPLTQFDRNRIQAQGAAELRDVAWQNLAAARATAQFQLNDGAFVIQPVVIEQDEGRTTLKLETTLANPKQWQLTTTVNNWPYATSAGSSARLWADANLQMDFKRASFEGPVNARAELKFHDQALGQASLQARADGRTILIPQISASALDGSFNGEGTILLDRPNASTVRIGWKNLDGARVADFFPAVKDLAGRFSGSALLAPSDDPRALEPLRLDVSLQSEQGRYRIIQIGDASLAAFLHLPEKPRMIEAAQVAAAREATGAQSGFPQPPPPNLIAQHGYEGWRFVMDDSTFRLADGTAKLWARADAHGGTSSSLQVRLDAEKIDLNQILHAFSPDSNNAPGRLKGTFTLVGSGAGSNPISIFTDTRKRQRMFGDGVIHLSDSDLKGTQIVGGLYNLMHLDLSGNEPTGTGIIRMRLEADTLDITDFRYFNRGTEVRAQATVKDAWQMPQSPLEGSAFGSLRPLKNIKLPFFAEADKVFAAIQKESVSVQISGNVKDPKIQPVLFGQISSQLRTVLLGDVKNEASGEAQSE
jgi:hypothetical protein